MLHGSVAALRARHHDNTDHSDHVCRLATTLFVGTLEVHRVSPIHLPVLQAGALLHNVGLAEDPEYHHTRGRDIVMAEGLRGFWPCGFTPEQVRMVACLVAFHRKPVHPEAEPLWAELPPELQSVTLRLAALLRVADGLDENFEQTTWIARIRGRRRANSSSSPRIAVYGHEDTVRSDVKRARKKADLWETCIGKRPRFVVTTQSRQPWRPSVGPGQTLAESAQVIMRGYLAQVIAQTPGVGTFQGIDPRHDMRVALRRLRSALRLYRRMWSPEAYDELVNELRWFGELLGAVRDHDVSILWLDKALSECPAKVRRDIMALRTQNARERRKELKALVAALREDRFGALLRRSSEWIEDGQNADADLLSRRSRLLRDEMYRALRRRMRKILAYPGTIDESASAQLHALRIECRRMRYAVEAWYGALGPGRQPFVQNLLAVQNALGDIHDADVRLGIWPDTPDKPSIAWLHERCLAERAKAWKAFQKTWPGLLRCTNQGRLKRMTRRS